jgi:hypothetical protein
MISEMIRTLSEEEGAIMVKNWKHADIVVMNNTKDPLFNDCKRSTAVAMLVHPSFIIDHYGKTSVSLDNKYFVRRRPFTYANSPTNPAEETGAVTTDEHVYTDTNLANPDLFTQ